MLNTEGGELLIGVKDDGSGFGIHHDYAYLGKKKDRDGFELWLMGLFIEQFGKIVANCIKLSFPQRDGVDICRVSIEPGSEPAYLKDEKQKKLYIRMGNSSHELDIDEIIKYYEQRFRTAPPARKKPKQAIAASLDGKKSKAKFSDFRGILQEVEKHPNQVYFVLKSIIINNLYGVDIMPEAVEICKLRLLLKLMSVVEPQNSRENMGVEALPDIDFNIRVGNTLVGFATLAQVRESVEKEKRGDMVQSLLGFSESSDTVTNLEEQASIIDSAFKQFRRQQVELGGNITSQQKNDLKKLLRKLTDELDHFLAGAYNIDSARQKKRFKEWKESHQPFHWLAEFYGLLANDGFDVVIGNPAYVEYSLVRQSYSLIGYSTEQCGNLYANVWERCLTLTEDLSLNSDN